MPEEAAQYEADELAGDPGDLVEAQRHAAVIGREGVGEDRRRVREQHRPADCLQDPHGDQPQRARRAVQPGHPQQDREHREHRESQVVDPHPAEHVAQSAERHHQHRSDQQVAQDYPQQQASVAWQQRVHPDSAEDVRQRDQDDRPVDRRHQRPQRGVGQGDPPVARAGHGGPQVAGQALPPDEPHNFLPASCAAQGRRFSWSLEEVAPAPAGWPLPGLRRPRRRTGGGA